MAYYIEDPNGRVMLVGCYFHFVQALWRRAAHEGLKKNDIIKTTKKIIHGIKILVFTLL